jgi:hypothetical protein
MDTIPPGERHGGEKSHKIAPTKPKAGERPRPNNRRRPTITGMGHSRDLDLGSVWINWVPTPIDPNDQCRLRPLATERVSTP